MLSQLFSNTDSQEKNEAVKDLIKRSSPRAHFFLMIILSVAMATVGVLLNSNIILIASMLIAPMLYPILTLAMGFVMGDQHLISRSSITILKSFGMAVVVSTLLGLFLKTGAFDPSLLESLLTGSDFLFLSSIVAVIAGLAGAYTLIKSELNESLPGVAIAVALIPPLASLGIGISFLNWEIIRVALFLFIINIAGIVFSASIIFSLFRLYAKRTVAAEAVKNDEKELKKEQTKDSKI